MTNRVKLVLLLIGAGLWVALYDRTFYALYVAKMPRFVDRVLCDVVCFVLYWVIASRIYRKRRPT